MLGIQYILYVHSGTYFIKVPSKVEDPKDQYNTVIFIQYSGILGITKVWASKTGLNFL